MALGLGTGSTVAFLLPAIAERGLDRLRCVATSIATEQQARALRLPVEEFETLERLDLAIDGADQISPYGLASTLRRLSQLGEVSVRPDTPRSPDGGVIADYQGEVDDPADLAARLAAVPGVVDHGLFPAEMVSEILIGRGDGVERA